MRLGHVFALRFSVLAAAVLAAWSAFFYLAVMEEVNDELDDSLEDYAETLILQTLEGRPMPKASSGSNNQFFLRPVTAEYAAQTPHIRYEDRNVYIEMKEEFEPARVLTYIYQRDDGQMMELEVSAPTIEKEDLQEAIVTWMVMLYVGLLLTVVAIGLWVTRRNMRPMRQLLRWLDRYVPGTGDTPPAAGTHIDEFDHLNQAVAQMARRNEESFEQQKTFIGNASHEMQTPLAVSQNRIEMLLEGENLSEQQMGQLVKTLHTLQGLSRLNRALLLLSRIENSQLADTVSVDLGARVEQQLSDMQSIFAPMRLSVSLAIEGRLCLTMNDDLATVLVSNLLKNAFVHNVEGGEVRVSVGPRGLCVKNSGVPQALDSSQIFARFYHTPGKASSSGLGLPLAQAVSQRYGLRLSYRFEAPLHTFELSVPPAEEGDA